MSNDTLNAQILEQLEEMKAEDIKVIDVSELTDVTDTMFIASGTSTRHVYAIASKLVENLKKQGEQPNSVTGMEDSEWILVDYVDAVVHVMLPEARELYQLEQLWQKVVRD